MIKKIITFTEEKFIEALYKLLKQNYPNCRESIKEEFENIKNNKPSQNIIRRLIEEDVKKYLKLISGNNNTDIEVNPQLIKLKCVMCGELARYIAFETNEPLCYKCWRNNLEARRK